MACQQLAILRAELCQFIESLDINDSGSVRTGVDDPPGEGFVADAHVACGGPLRLAASGGIARGGEFERLREMSLGIACRLAIGRYAGKRDRRKTRVFQ